MLSSTIVLLSSVIVDTTLAFAVACIHLQLKFVRLSFEAIGKAHDLAAFFESTPRQVYVKESTPTTFTVSPFHAIVVSPEVIEDLQAYVDLDDSASSGDDYSFSSFTDFDCDSDTTDDTCVASDCDEGEWVRPEFDADWDSDKGLHRAPLSPSVVGNDAEDKKEILSHKSLACIIEEEEESSAVAPVAAKPTSLLYWIAEDDEDDEYFSNAPTFEDLPTVASSATANDEDKEDLDERFVDLSPLRRPYFRRRFPQGAPDVPLSRHVHRFSRWCRTIPFCHTPDGMPVWYSDELGFYREARVC